VGLSDGLVAEPESECRQMALRMGGHSYGMVFVQ
jgi:hypothetical protein